MRRAPHGIDPVIDAAAGATVIGVSADPVDANGRVAHVIPEVSPNTHDEEVLAALRERPAA